MKKNYLLKPVYSKVGWAMLLVGALFLILYCVEMIPEIEVTVFSIVPGTPVFHSVIENGKEQVSFLQSNEINDEIGTVMVMLGLLLVAFSGEKDEDEFTDALRLRSWFLAGITYGILYIMLDVLVYGISYLYYMWFIQGGILLLIYILIFKTKLYLSRRACDGQQS